MLRLTHTSPFALDDTRDLRIKGHILEWNHCWRQKQVSNLTPLILKESESFRTSPRRS